MMKMMMMMMMAPASRAAESVKARNRMMGLVLVLGIAGAACMPYFVQKLRDGRSLYASEDPLTGSQIMRGAYINTGSKDVGPDPDFDHSKGEWHGRRNDPFKK